jgi:hypothetical protein
MFSEKLNQTYSGLQRIWQCQEGNTLLKWEDLVKANILVRESDQQETTVTLSGKLA